MDNIRFKALQNALTTPAQKVEYTNSKISDYFGSMTFNRKAMQEYLPQETYLHLIQAIDKGEKIDRKLADQVATALKAWALSKNATHYTHWFQPLTGETAEKHDAFFTPVDDGNAIESFSGSQLVQQEPDASSFPSGGIRSTFEARGYTAWDPSSPSYIIDQTLCIPSIFVSYTSESLDYKSPLLRSCSAIDKAASEVCKLFDKNVIKVVSTLGIEQEYFLVDSSLFFARPDLVLTGRTLLGHASAKDQQLEDNYFGAIPERVISFMKDFEIEAYKLGIPLKTRHNEVAPCQFECAPFFEEVNLAIDHNQLLMQLIERIAHRHNFVALLHEKPYAGVNGSGKHNNWSLRTNSGTNLLSPGKTPESNLRFLTFLVNILVAVDDYSDILRASIASASNDLRLGANEAPPAIISAFVGKKITETLDMIEKGISEPSNQFNSELSINIPTIPEILMDNTDRNRTSPFAFTGNKFEFRAVGSSANCAHPITVLNTIVAEQLIKFKNELDSELNKGIKTNDAILNILRNYIISSKKIRFEGNNYSEEWLKEAEKRGLPNVNSTPFALKAFSVEKNILLFEKHQVYTARELEARHEIFLEEYTKKVQIESRVLGDLAINHVIPTVIKYQNILIENVKGLKEIFDKSTFEEVSGNQLKSIHEMSKSISEIISLVETMTEERKKANRLHEAEEKAIAYNEKIRPYLDEIRNRTDKLETLVDDELWTLPKYRELLFTR